MHQGLPEDLPILIGEADEVVAERLRFLLEEDGARVAVETTGSRVLDRVLNQSFELLFVAVRLPVLSGIDTLMLLRQNRVSTPAIGLVDADYANELLVRDAGFASLLDRTLVVEEVQAALSVALDLEETKLAHDDGGQRKTSVRVPFFSKLANRLRRE